MLRPDHLRHPIDLDAFPNPGPRILRHKRHVIRRISVLRCNDEIPTRRKPRDLPVCRRHDSLSLRHRQRAYRDKVILNIDQNQRSFRHRFGDDTIRNSMADQPIIHSLLDVDFYKDTMGQMIFHRHPAVPVKLEFRNRHTHVRLAECIDLAELRENLEHLRGLRFTLQELDFLSRIRLSNKPMFQPDYIQFLHTLRLPEFHLDVRDGQLTLEFSGAWPSVSRWETLALQVVSELYGEFQSRDLRASDRATIWDEGNRRLEEKIQAIKRNPGITLSDFGSRRRWSRKWQEHVVVRLAAELPGQFRGTSNSDLSMKHDLTPMGTNAHELPMVYSAIFRDEDERAQRLVSSQRVLEDWEEEYGLDLSIFLPDTYGSENFFSLVSKHMLETWKGSRHDSGPPKEYGDRRIEMYASAGIDAANKLIVFSDGLTVPLMVELEQYFRGRIQTTFGIGTNLTNDLGFAPLSMVVKVAAANGLPVVKLSDNISKASGDPKENDRIKRLTGYTTTFSEACRY
jgi:nicotinate phosphoribosyltransferase